jgi:hypothetical protein
LNFLNFIKGFFFPSFKFLHFIEFFQFMPILAFHFFFLNLFVFFVWRLSSLLRWALKGFVAFIIIIVIMRFCFIFYHTHSHYYFEMFCKFLWHCYLGTSYTSIFRYP